MSCAVRLMPAKVLFSDASRSTRPLRDAMRFSSARDQAEETRRRHNAAARRALELARPNVMLSYMESNSAPMSFISSKLGTASSLMSGYEETGDESQSARNCPDSARLDSTSRSSAGAEAKILLAEAEENHLDDKRWNERWARWRTCSLCEQDYHGVVRCALGWACWKMYLGRPEADDVRRCAMGELGNGLFAVNNHEDALSVQEAELSMMRRLDVSEEDMLVVQTNLAITYEALGRLDSALQMKHDVYSGRLKLYGKQHEATLLAANNYAWGLVLLERYEEAKSLMRKTMPVARRVLGEGNDLTLKMRAIYAEALYRDPAATLEDLRLAVNTLEGTERTARRVLGSAHPMTVDIGRTLQAARPALARASQAK